jgi:hypothetical protein
MLLSGTFGKMIHEKILKQKISWHCTFKDSRQLHASTVRSMFETPQSLRPKQSFSSLHKHSHDIMDCTVQAHMA